MINSSTKPRNNSRLAAAPMKRNSGRITSRPIAKMTAMAISACPIAHANASTTDPSLCAAKAASRNRIGRTASSWHSRMAELERPVLVPRRWFSAKSCMTIAVEDSANPKPSTTATGSVLSKYEAINAIAVPVKTTCAPPSPNTRWRIAHSRSTESSRPIMNKRNTTPSSARARTLSESAITA